MNFDNYKVTTIVYPNNPKKPESIKSGVVVNELNFVQFQEDLEKYTKAHKEYIRIKNDYHKEEKFFLEQFKQDLFNEFGLSNHPKRERMFNFVWSKVYIGNGSRYEYYHGEAYDMFAEIAMFVKEN